MSTDLTRVLPRVVVPPVDAPEDAYAAALFRRQRRYLRAVLRRAFPYRRPVQHDVACADGRAVRLLNGLVREAHGYDRSPARLAVASRAGLFASWHLVTEAVPVPATDDGPAVVTAFGLLPEGRGEDPERAVAFAARVLPHHGAGLLVVENTGNSRALGHLRRPSRGGGWAPECAHEQVAALLRWYGFEIVELAGFGVLPPARYRGRLGVAASRVDDTLSGAAPLGRYAREVVYIARRVTGAP
ncbi:MAG TPA: SAM-dependent methyltransferase [Micromonosporaceae bacterium]